MAKYTQKQLQQMNAVLAGTFDKLDTAPKSQPGYTLDQIYGGILPASPSYDNPRWGATLPTGGGATPVSVPGTAYGSVLTGKDQSRLPQGYPYSNPGWGAQRPPPYSPMEDAIIANEKRGPVNLAVTGAGMDELGPGTSWAEVQRMKLLHGADPGMGGITGDMHMASGIPAQLPPSDGSVGLPLWASPPPPTTFAGSSTGRQYNIGQTYSSGGYLFQMTPDGPQQMGRDPKGVIPQSYKGTPQAAAAAAARERLTGGDGMDRSAAGDSFSGERGSDGTANFWRPAQHMADGGIVSYAGAMPAGTPGIAPSSSDVAAANAKKSSVWDNIVDGASGIVENTLLGRTVKSLFPDFYYGGAEGIKSLDNHTGPVDFPVIDNSDHPERGSDTSRNQWGPTKSFDKMHPNELAAWNAMHDENGYERPRAGWGPHQPHTPTPPPVIPPVTPPVTPPTTGGTGQSNYDRFGRVVFPDMPPYRPGIDGEFLYFQKMADGGIVGYADGGAVAQGDSTLDGSDPRVALIADTEDVLAELAQGKKPDGHDAEVLKKFVKAFGDTALKQLHDSVAGGATMRGGRLIRGAGGPQDDAIPARVDNVHEARLSDGEFVVPQAAVAAAGNGDHAAGAQKMQEMSNALQGIGPGQPMNVEQVG